MTILWAKVTNFGTKILTKSQLFFIIFFQKNKVQPVLHKGNQSLLKKFFLVNEKKKLDFYKIRKF